MSIHPGRIHTLTPLPYTGGPVAYWMSRDQRADDNWALIHARNSAMASRASFRVIFTLAPSFLNATSRHYQFMLTGLCETERALAERNIPMYVILGDPAEIILQFIRKHAIKLLVTDFDPIRIKQRWCARIASSAAIPFHEIDAHNIVPCRFVSQKKEFAARTIRPKINRLLDSFLTPFPKPASMPSANMRGHRRNNWDAIASSRNTTMTAPEINWIVPGARAAHTRLTAVIKTTLKRYHHDANDPALDAASRLSPYLHFGQLSAQRVALSVDTAADVPPEAKESFLEQLIVRRELADNFCLNEKHYDIPAGFPAWAKRTLAKHAKDKREYLYTYKLFEEAKTHDALWNAAQTQLRREGYMHGYMRMYWAKKILEWTRSPAEAMRIAVRLNDTWQLDGRDPNGYTGIAWSVGGVHDRPWGEHPVFGQIRYMNYNGCKSKFDIAKYIERYGAST
ncbi:MAG: deoxyribodipyrimidine photo-lyase [Spirochaetes bacterium]|nr:deoxyribodipyrimidine photo-lyase [Spirochaetota bacterium]